MLQFQQSASAWKTAWQACTSVGSTKKRATPTSNAAPTRAATGRAQPASVILDQVFLAI
jgi:hypothetical protein